MKKTKILSLVLLCSMIMTSMASALNSSEQQAFTNEDELIIEVENKIAEVDDMLHQQYKDVERSPENLSYIQSIRQSAIDEALAPLGFTKMEQDTPMPASSSSAITFSDSIYFNNSFSGYVYTADWSFSKSDLDVYYDIEDFAAVRMTNPSDYYYYKTFAKTWDTNGDETGYVDSNGVSTPSDYCGVTKQFEDATGVIFNVYDVVVDLGNKYARAADGRITAYIKKKSNVSGTPYNKVITDYNHNYKQFSANADAKVSVTNFTEIGGSLNIVYSKVNKQWLRSSGGQIIGS